jgi:hypothetical protein
MEGFDEQELDFLQTADRQTVLRNIKEIRESNNPLYIGQRLSELHTLLQPYGYFTKAIAAVRLVQRTAYGYMNGYRNAAKLLPEGAVQAMMDRKLVINSNRSPLGEWTEAVNLVPPPKAGSDAAYSRWVDELIERKPKRLTGHQANRVRKDPDDLLLECAHVIERALKRLPPQRAVRERFGRRVVELAMRYFSLDPGKFSPADTLPEKSKRADT